MLLKSAVIIILDLLDFTWLFFNPLWKLLEPFLLPVCPDDVI